MDSESLAARLLPLIDACQGLTAVERGSASWSQAANLLFVIHQAEIHLELAGLVAAIGPSARDVTEAILGVLRASVHPRAGSPTLREQAYKALIAWSRELRQSG